MLVNCARVRADVHVRDLARAAAQVRGLNLYPTRGGVTHFGQVRVNR
jgi:hypothetical protein